MAYPLTERTLGPATLAKLVKYAATAKRYGIARAYTTAVEARRAGISLSLAYALVEQETWNGKNVFGHDPTSSIPRAWRGTYVTAEKYRYYKGRRPRYGMQGVGPLQLTWYAIQDKADRLGGCHVPKYNLRVGFATLAALIRTYGYAGGVRRYNGSGAAAEAYSRSVRTRAVKWRGRL